MKTEESTLKNLIEESLIKAKEAHDLEIRRNNFEGAERLSVCIKNLSESLYILLRPLDK